MNVKDVMSPAVTLATPNTSIKEAAAKMAEHGVGFLPVGENDRLQGTVTDRDIVIRAISQGQDPNTAVLRDLLTDELVYCHEDQPAEEAAQLMGEHQIRRLPVVNGDKRLVGVVSIGDMARHCDTATVGKLLSNVASWR